MMDDTYRSISIDPAYPNNSGKIAKLGGRFLDVEEIADIIWLSAQIWQSAPDIDDAEEHERPEHTPSEFTPSSLPQSSEPTTSELNQPNRADTPSTKRKPIDHDSELQITRSAESSASIHLSLDNDAQYNSNEGPSAASGTPFFVPTASALPHQLELARSLRPLKRNMPSSTQMELDEISSAEKSADTNTPTIILKPKKRRWLDIALVIDQSPTMAMWQRTVDEFIILLEQTGAFRNILVYSLVYEQTGQQDQLTLYATTQAHQGNRRVCDPTELIDPHGERLILTVSDTCSKAWYTGTAPALLQQWSQHGPVTILHMLPRPMWQQTTLVNELDVKLSSHTPCVPNGKLQVVEWPWYWDIDGPTEEDDTPGEALTDPIPVIILEPYSLGAWASLGMGIK